MDKLNKFVTHPVVVLLSFVFTFGGFLLTLSNNIILQCIAVGILVVCTVVITACFIKYRFNIRSEKTKIEKEIRQTFEVMIQEEQKSYLAKAYAGMEKTMEFVRTLVDNSLHTKQVAFSEDHFRAVCKNICATVRTILLNVCNIDFSVCIKQIHTEEIIDYDYKNATTQTIARSGHKIVERSQNDSEFQKISDNTSFSDILETNSCWASPNLEFTASNRSQGGSTYKNPDENYRKYYKSTIVAPIRINSKYISPTITNCTSSAKPERYHYIAFLCVDSPETFELEDPLFTLASMILGVCGDALYPLFENKLIKEIENI